MRGVYDEGAHHQEDAVSIDVGELDKAEPTPQQLHKMRESELETLAESYKMKLERFEEAYLGQLALQVDNVGWKPLGTGVQTSDNGLDLAHIKNQAELGMALATANPQVKRGVAVRTSYIWGMGVKLEYDESATYAKSLRRTVGKTLAQFEIERTLAAAGNLFLEVDGDGVNRRVRSVPIEHVTGGSANLYDSGVLDYILLEYDVWRTQDQGSPTPSNTGGSGSVRRVQEWVPTFEQEGPTPARINDIGVNTTKRIKHVAVNRMRNWWWGVPDLYAVTFWSRAYKKYLEQCHTLNEAYATIAHKVSTSSARGAERAASQMAANPGVDPSTGQPLNIGGTAIMGAGQDLVAMQTGRPVDFSNGLPLAAMVAAGLEIPLQVMTSDASTGGSRASDNTLDEATKKAMQARQQMINDELEDLAQMLGLSSFDIDWPRVGEEPLHRTLQALDVAIKTGMLYKDEAREEVVRALGREVGEKTDPPSEDELPLTVQLGQGQQAAIEPGSYGEKDLRDEPGMQQHTNET